LFEQFKNDQTLISFHGDLNSSLITSLLHVIERKLEYQGSSVKAKKRVFNVLVESLQNLYHHASAAGDEMKKVAVAISGTKNEYYITTGNLVENSKVSLLEEKLEGVSGLDSNKLRDIYQEQLDQGALSKKGGAGLGIVDLARRSNGELKYKFVKVNEEFSFFTLKIKVID